MKWVAGLEAIRNTGKSLMFGVSTTPLKRRGLPIENLAIFLREMPVGELLRSKPRCGTSTCGMGFATSIYAVKRTVV